MGNALEGRLAKVADQLEIAQVINAYAEGVDGKRAELVMSCFHPDATFQYLDEAPAPVAAFFAASAPNAEGLVTTCHYLSNHVAIVDGDSADSQVYLWAYHLVNAKAPHRPPLFPAKGEAYAVIIGGRYLDRFERRDGRWRIARRRLVFDWSFNAPAAEIVLPPMRDAGLAPRMRAIA